MNKNCLYLLMFGAGVLTLGLGCSEHTTAPPPTPPPATADATLSDDGWFTTHLAEQYNLAVWASPYSASGGDTLSIFVDSKSAKVSIRIFRLGWYASAGGHLVWQVNDVPAQVQQPCSPPFPGPVECAWTSTVNVPIRETWQAGIYLIRVIDESGVSALYPFVVSSPSIHPDFTVVVSQFTWQAYNTYGGSGLYTRDPATGRNVPSVSFERPYDHNGGAGVLYESGSSNDISVLRWLERSGYKLNYVSDVDLTDQKARSMDFGKGLLFIGHDEYWTWDEFDRVLALRDSGKHMVFFAGNTAYWNVRLRPGSLTGEIGGIVDCFKWTGDPGAATPIRTTVRFRDAPLNRPENQLTGVMYNGLGGAAVQYPLPFVVADSAVAEGKAFLTGAALNPGDSILGLIGPEGDMIVKNGLTPPNLQVLFRATLPVGAGRISNAAAFYVAPSGAGVFAAGNNYFGRGLDGLFGQEDTRLTALMEGVLDWMLVR
jgi:hypothetical protein